MKYYFEITIQIIGIDIFLKKLICITKPLQNADITINTLDKERCCTIEFQHPEPVKSSLVYHHPSHAGTIHHTISNQIHS